MKTWPPVIHNLVDEIIAVAKARGLHGRVRLQKNEAGDYEIVLVIPKEETVMTRAARK